MTLQTTGSNGNDHKSSVPAEIDYDDPRTTRFEKVKAAARQDGVEIVHYEPQFPERGSKTEKRMTRTVSLMFLLVGLFGTAFVVLYIAWPWRWEQGNVLMKWYTPLLGITLGLTALFIGFAILTWGKKLLPREVSIQERHDGGSPEGDRRAVGQTLAYMVEELGVKRRPLLGLAAAAGLAPVAVVFAAPIVGGLIKNPHADNQMFTTGWAPIKEANGGTRLIRLTREDGTPIRPGDVSAGGQMTVFPGIPGGASNAHADSPTLLIHLRPDDGAVARANNVKGTGHNKFSTADFMYGDFIAYSKICTHAGCPASLYEQQTNRLLCPCHQSQFLITDNAKPVFGPASRSLPQLPLAVDDEGYFVAKSDYQATVGPDFWERP
ncbi:cytochrome bc1 complex Rieske iron-sulfur subunit [Asanoa iriomotensis]|uniref:Cytochrome bc1 complex Rieske iron-sulfur subunit n=1 Tax=Asanoa iriomotensis TaxID=234613 RepID=A0ABQ4BX27_9ACTN|nr:Rieske 2Fe-2S domain-containing protein [Asanoa iriomotensis]GIF55071.1 putative ubiquinol-cytochrome c reductase iron-sulfur subunit (Rieske iron-sulfur protein) [Asanoa iriomotensis]